ncbi:MAG: DUF4157 domain-containing protein [Deltaproteobacteria bacterium]|nr:DUF4157 domain-containing protein [Deltaproteobacteria bacterium]
MTRETQAPSEKPNASSRPGDRGALHGELRRADSLSAPEALLSPEPPPVQRRATGVGAEGASVHEAAARGVAGSGGALPHAAAIQASFGRHGVGDINAHVGGAASSAAREMGASAYATGEDVAFASSPDLHTAAHEAAHVVQQRAGVQLSGGIGRTGDAYERHADAVADRVVQGESAEDLLDGHTGGGGAVQRRAVQRRDNLETAEPEVTEVITEPQGTNVSRLADIVARVDAVAATGALSQAGVDQIHQDLADSRWTFEKKADYVHAVMAGYHERYDGNPNAARFVPGAQLDLAWYEQSAIETVLVENGWSGMLGSISLSDASWLRLVMFAEQRGIDLTAMAGGKRGERALDEGQVASHAAALGQLVATGAGNAVVGGSTFEVACSEYHHAWLQVGTAYRRTASALVEDRLAANERKDDAEESRLNEIRGMISAADTLGDAIGTVMGNLNTLQDNVASWQSTVSPLSVGVSAETGKIAIEGGDVEHVDGAAAMENLRGYAGSASNAGGKIIEFIFDGEIRRCQAAVAAVADHRAAFAAVVGRNEAIARAEEFQGAVENLRLKATAMAREADVMQRAHQNFGNAVDNDLRSQGAQRRGEEQAVGYMFELATIRECASYTQNALMTADVAEERTVAMRDRVGSFMDGKHATGDLEKAAAGLDGEWSRYEKGRLLAAGIKRMLARRGKHLATLGGMYTSGLGQSGSTDGRDHY